MPGYSTSCYCRSKFLPYLFIPQTNLAEDCHTRYYPSFYVHENATVRTFYLSPSTQLRRKGKKSPVKPTEKVQKRSQKGHEKMPIKSYIGSNHVVLTPNTAAGNTRGATAVFKKEYGF
jgi:hypothetical protein